MSEAKAESPAMKDRANVMSKNSRHTERADAGTKPSAILMALITGTHGTQTNSRTESRVLSFTQSLFPSSALFTSTCPLAVSSTSKVRFVAIGESTTHVSPRAGRFKQRLQAKGAASDDIGSGAAVAASDSASASTNACGSSATMDE
eukprot:Amastigsp_a848707_20.p4 type:complete len:147 gc:universal Amastigsp_a848707_20:38-478(+)